MQARNPYDIQGLRVIGGIVATVLEELALGAKPGITTADLDAMACRLLTEQGAEATPIKEYDFPGALCVSINDEVVHGIPGSRVLRQGDLLKLDLTADKHGFVADAARMVLLEPADPLSRRLADCSRRACEAAIAHARDGVSLTVLGGIIHDVAAKEGFRVVKDLCGHGVGRRTHEEPEVPNFADQSNSGLLRRGMVITIEPILSAGSGEVAETGDGWTLVTTDGSRTGHYEETVIIGRDNAEVVTIPVRYSVLNSS